MAKSHPLTISYLKIQIRLIEALHRLKSEKARLDLSSKQRKPSVRERSVLFLANGMRTKDELMWLLQGDVGMLQKLMAAG